MISRSIQKVPEGDNELRVFLRKILRDHYRDIRDIFVGEAVLEGVITEGNVGVGTTSLQDYAKLEVNTTSNKSIYTMDSDNGGLLIGYQGSTIQGRTTEHDNTQSLLLQRWGGNVGFKTTDPTALCDIDSDILRLRTAKTPASAGADGNAGDICWDSDYVYVCVADNTWKRSALSSW